MTDNGLAVLAGTAGTLANASIALFALSTNTTFPGATAVFDSEYCALVVCTPVRGLPQAGSGITPGC